MGHVIKKDQDTWHMYASKLFERLFCMRCWCKFEICLLSLPIIAGMQVEQGGIFL